MGEVYWENMVVMVASTVWALDRSVAVASMKMSRVARVILEWAPLMRGGRDSTLPAASRITGYTGDPAMMSTYGLMCWTLGSVR